MSMEVITGIQLLELVVAYLCLTVFLPHFVLGKTLKLKNRYEKFLIYTIVGNFFAMNLVFLTELLHIGYPVVIVLLTLATCIGGKIWLEKIPVKAIVKEQVETFRRLSEGQLKWKAYVANNAPKRKARRRRIREHFFDVYVMELPDVILILTLLAALFYVFGITHFEQFGYKASDLIVHNYWVNSLRDQKLFVTGVYPYGFHCIIYFINCFGMPIYVSLRLIAFVEVVWDVLMVLCFLKMICKAKYTPYIGTFAYVLAAFFRENTYSRYAASLPQEYGIIFIVPAVYCLIAFMRAQRIENRGSVSKRNRIYLYGFAMSFSLTIAVHFYGTVIAGLYCVAIAIGFCAWIFRRPYFRRILIAGLVSVAIALAPMVICFATGTPLHGSFTWGLSVLSGSQVQTSDAKEAAFQVEEVDKEETDRIARANQAVFEQKYGKVVGKALYIVDVCRRSLAGNIFSVPEEKLYLLYGVLGIVPITMLCGILCMAIRKKDTMYGAALLSSGIYYAMMVVLISCYELQLPALMDTNRGGVYFAYSTALVSCLCVDGLLYLLFEFRNKKILSQCIAILCVCATLGSLFYFKQIREPLLPKGMESNASVTCLTNIMREEKRFQWTIVSANDENRMAYDMGYHYELVNFLREMEQVGTLGRVRIPTETVYMFIEKIPGDYFEKWEGSGQRISEEGCLNRIPPDQGLSVYQGRNRWIVMSRAYAWAQKFKELYPNEISVYYETDDFVCYRITQNPYRLFNFAIDYDYNMRFYEEVEETENSDDKS